MPEIALFATDLHGDIHEYEHLLELGSGKNVKAVIIGGDISPFLTVLGDIALYQREFIEYYLLPRLRDFKQKSGKDVFLMMGNDDLKVNRDVLEKGEKEGLFRIINQKVYRLGKLHIAGYSFINETPFMLKDWEKSENDIKKDLLALAKKSDPKRTIYSMHAPPLGTALDVIFSGEHVGSSSIREFIEEKQPYLTLHGHIHESPQVSGHWKEVLGGTISVNPGKQNVLVFDINDLNTMKLLSV
ncbi:MAG: metallophosphoesterase [Candidatus Aenigmarchaeota archaeon]|nr:metallophosphoesterase [Candidatus Aenigmarchaeota archaeon]